MRWLSIIGIGLGIYSCAATSVQMDRELKVAERQDLGEIEFAGITEASGMAASHRNPGVFWVHNDSGDENRIYALDRTGKHLGIFYISGCPAFDWEDVAVGPGPEVGKSYIYIGDIGDNLGVRKYVAVCRVMEPQLDTSAKPVTDSLGDVTFFKFRYPDGPRDAETLMLDPGTLDLYIVSKRDRYAHVYKGSTASAKDVERKLELVGSLPITGVTAGDISTGGMRIIVKDLRRVYLWSRRPGESLGTVFKRPPTQLRYVQEPQGEAICWGARSEGYYTTSEEPLHIPAHLYFYPLSQ